MAEPDSEPTATFEFGGPDARRFLIYFEGIAGAPPTDRRGWRIIVEDKDESGAWRPLFDTWEEHFDDISSYLLRYLPWRNEASRQLVAGDVRVFLGA